MSINCEDIYCCAEKLANNASCEVEYRNAIGRAYYFAFHHAKSFHNQLSEPGRAPDENTHGSHESLIYRLTHPTVKEAEQKNNSKKIGYMLQGMKFWRTQADYELDSTITQDDLENVWGQTSNIHGIK